MMPISSETAVLTPVVAIRGNRFDASLTKTSQLCLEMSKDRFRFCVIQAGIKNTNPRCIWLEDYTFSSLLTDNRLLYSLEIIYRDHPVLQAGFWKSIHVSINTPSFTLIPGDLFRKEYATHYLQLMRGNTLSVSEQTHAYFHQKEHFYNVFDSESWIKDWLSEAYPLQQTNLMHQTSALIQASITIEQTLEQECLFFLYFEEEYITILYRKNGALHFCNKYAFKSSNDLIYYLLYVIQELHLDQKTMPITLFGEITPYADIYWALSQFLPTMTFGTSLPGLTLIPGFDDLPDHRYISLHGAFLAVD